MCAPAWASIAPFIGSRPGDLGHPSMLLVRQWTKRLSSTRRRFVRAARSFYGGVILAHLFVDVLLVFGELPNALAVKKDFGNSLFNR